MWFLLGGLGSTAGCLLGCVGGVALGARLNPVGVSFFPSPAEAGCAVGCAILFGVLADADRCAHVSTQRNTTSGATPRQIS